MLVYLRLRTSLKLDMLKISARFQCVCKIPFVTMPPEVPTIQIPRRGASQHSDPKYRLAQWAAKLEMESLTLKRALQQEFKTIRELVGIEHSEATTTSDLLSQLGSVLEAQADAIRNLGTMAERNSRDLDSIKQYLSSLVPRLENIELHIREMGDDDNCIQVFKHN